MLSESRGVLDPRCACGRRDRSRRAVAGSVQLASLPLRFHLLIRFASTAQYVAGRNRCNRSMNRASLPIRIRGWFFSMPVMMRCAAAGGVVLAIASKRSIDSARRALSVMPTPLRELRTMLVSTPPGCTTDSFTGLFAIASSCRRLSEKPRTANFAAAYAVWPGGAMMPKSEERLTMCAARCFERCGRNARVPCTTPQKLMLISHSICAWSTSLKAPSSATPALLMTMLSCGWAAMAAFANSWICAGSPTSTRWVDTLRVATLPISAATCCSPASSRSASARSQPRAASSSASARPMPLAAPVTAAALPDIAVIGMGSMQVETRGGFRNFRKLEPNHKALSALNVDYRATDGIIDRREHSREASWDNQNHFARRPSLSKTIRCNGT